MQPPDIINGLFETLGTFAALGNVRAILRDRSVKGFSPWVVLFFTAWGLWNAALYYPGLNQSFSALASAGLVAVNSVWLGLIVWYHKRPNLEIERIYGLRSVPAKASRMIVSTSDGRQFYTVPVTGWTTFLFSTLNRVNRLGLRIAYLRSGM